MSTPSGGPMLDQITPLLITYNEADNLERTLPPLAWAKRIVVIDSGSTDATLQILGRFPAVEVFKRPFDTFAGQCNFGLEKVRSPFTLSLDADYVAPEALIREIAALDLASADGWYARFGYCVQGTPLRATLLPPRMVLYRTSLARYVDDGHAHRVTPPPRVAYLRERMLHDDRKPLSRWLASQTRYSNQEADKLSGRPWGELGWGDRCRRLFLGPLLVPVYCLIVKGLILDGRRGLHYVFQRTLAEILLALRLLDRLLANDKRE